MSCYRIPEGVALPPGEVVVHQDHLRLPPVPRVVPEARRFVDAHAPGVPAEVRDVLLLLTSELVTNAVIHARTEVEIGITVTDQSLLVTVHDEDLGRQELPGPTREGGRGLNLVRALSAASATVHHLGDGKTAWFRLSRGVSA